MPLDPISSAILSSVVSTALQAALTPAPVEPAMGIVRFLPAETKIGEMYPPWDGQVRIGNYIYTLSPGAVFRNELNMIIPPMLVQTKTKVRYMLDATGMVQRVWVLSAAEARLPENTN